MHITIDVTHNSPLLPVLTVSGALRPVQSFLHIFARFVFISVCFYLFILLFRFLPKWSLPHRERSGRHKVLMFSFECEGVLILLPL